MPDVIVTGLPRSGATVVSALIDYLPNAVCLNMPDWHATQSRKIRGVIPFCKWMTGDFIYRRAQLLKQTPLRDWRASDGAPLLDSIKDARQPKNTAGKPESVLFARPHLKGDFILGMKHNALYTAILPTLVAFNHYKIIAVIRHPVDTLLAWQSMSGRAIAQGKVPAATRFWPEAVRISSAKTDTLDRMVQLYEAHLERYHSLRGQIDIVKYEDVIGDPMKISKILGADSLSAAARLIEQRRRVRMADDADVIRTYLRKHSVFTKHYYPEL